MNIKIKSIFNGNIKEDLKNSILLIDIDIKHKKVNSVKFENPFNQWVLNYANEIVSNNLNSTRIPSKKFKHAYELKESLNIQILENQKLWVQLGIEEFEKQNKIETFFYKANIYSEDNEEILTTLKGYYISEIDAYTDFKNQYTQLCNDCPDINKNNVYLERVYLQD